ncbi:hypothetical protein RMSM_07677 [Rhodopirellula maiorica SM1]|uniref:Uncharacterized protein n=1 Tax=Rhodopirellula maiorica SM1 TaxID=1265738 RepID=M5RN48_9BACT|nr:hypothetical protein [Rhodopirellula maiorica]EMI15399.1 hypothetical protein RMSM_07677 [Rhodopirellula maiorica SM1]
MNSDRRLSAAARHAIDRLCHWARRVRSRSDTSCRAATMVPLPIRHARGYRPMLRPLEPRLVLNATAELSGLGELLITGTAAADTVQLQVTGDGSLQLRDEINQIIPITNHPGNPNDPLAAAAVTSGQIVVRLGGGDDTFTAELPSNLSVTVVDGDGSDTTELTFTDRGPVGTATHSIDSESITLVQDSTTVSLSDDHLVLTGDVSIGTINDDSLIDVGTGRFDVDGRLILSGSVDFIGSGGSVDLQDAVVTSNADNVDLSFDLGTQPTATLAFGDTDASGGRLLTNLNFIDTAADSLQNSSIEISGNLVVQNQVNAIQIGEVVDAENIDLETSSDVSLGLVNATLGELSIAATGNVVVNGTASIDNALAINANGGNVDLSMLSLSTTSGGDIFAIDNATSVTLGNVDAADANVLIGQSGIVQGDVTQSDTTRLNINQLSIRTNGMIELTSADNDIAVAESLDANGDITLVDSANGLDVRQIRSSEGNVELQSTASGFALLISGAIATSGGEVRITAAEQIRMRETAAINAGDGTIRIDAQGDVTLGALVTTNATENAVRIQSFGGAVQDTGDTGIDIDANFGRATITAATGVGDGNPIELRVAEFAASVTGTGAILVVEQDSLRLVDLETFDGEIKVTASDSIVIEDERPEQTNGDFQVTPRLVAGGAGGRIFLDAGNDDGDRLRIGNGVALVASQSSIGAVQLDANAIEFGEQIEIRTGGDIGVARVFSPRPVLPADLATSDSSDPAQPDDAIFDPADAAFYDTASIVTDRLTQALGNGGAGVLTIGVGHVGEQGLTLNIDWGGEFQRFQQVDLLAGGELHPIEHAYTEQDILESRLNGRTSATDPLEVRFSVRHHESIIVTGNSVTQGSAETEQVQSGVISATDNDNPLRPDLDETIIQNTVADNATLLHVNGQAQFIIPSLTIPVAFFPVRNVIPEPETLEIFVRLESTVDQINTNLQTSEAARGSAVVRDEYFQIRVISPDPEGDDLAAPKRLQDTILEGDNLKRLFAKLPDGRYVIEYVLGDGNERIIIQADVRNGEAIDLGDELDGGYLKLKMLDLVPQDTTTPEQSDAPAGEEASERDPLEPDNGDGDNDVSALDRGMRRRVEGANAVVKHAGDNTESQPTTGLATAADDRLTKAARFARLARSQF